MVRLLAFAAALALLVPQARAEERAIRSKPIRKAPKRPVRPAVKGFGGGHKKHTPQPGGNQGTNLNMGDDGHRFEKRDL